METLFLLGAIVFTWRLMTQELITNGVSQIKGISFWGPDSLRKLREVC